MWKDVLRLNELEFVHNVLLCDKMLHLSGCVLRLSNFTAISQSNWDTWSYSFVLTALAFVDVSSNHERDRPVPWNVTLYAVSIKYKDSEGLKPDNEIIDISAAIFQL